jgi:uncharacterized repeat protein (TIGR04138 family)
VTPFDELIVQIRRLDRRYALEAYGFVVEGLDHATDLREERGGRPRPRQGEEATEDDHISGPELCDAIRGLALERYGMLAAAVLRSWGVTTTRDLGNIVFNLVEAGGMRKRDEDRVEDFDDCFDLTAALSHEVELIP